MMSRKRFNKKEPYYWIMFLVILFSCSSERPASQKSAFSPRDIIPGLASPVVSNVDRTTIDLNDFIESDITIDSVTVEGEVKDLVDSEVHIEDWPATGAMTTMVLWEKGTPFSIPLKRTDKREVKFQFSAEGKVFESVQLKGEMTAWGTIDLVYNGSEDVYETDLILEPRDYQYIMVLNGAEQLDFNNPDSIDNGIGGFNSLLRSQDKIQESLLLSSSYDGSLINLSTKGGKVDYLVLWEDQELPVIRNGSVTSVNIPEVAKKLNRSHIRIWAYDENRISNDLLIPLSEGKPVLDAQAISRYDKHAMTLYNVFVDRFHNGDKTNDRPINTGEVLPLANDMGGDIRGAIQKLEDGYFEELGINTIWISPIVKNVEGAFGEWPEPATKFSAYHGYWPISFTLIDDRKGTPDDLHELVKKAHEKDMNVLLDFVANHVHEQHPFYKSDSKVATNLYLPDGSLNTERWDDHRLTTWFDVFLPTLKLDEPRVYETLTDSAVYWIEEYDLDGFRHDATKHVPEIFWKTLTRKLKDGPIKNGRDLYQIGETYGSADLISSYVNSGQLDAQFDFNLYDATVASLCRADMGFDRLDDEMHKSLNTYGHHHLMGNITGNQDRGRFISYAGGALKFDENAKVAGWTRDVGVGDEVAYSRTKQLMAIIATIPGLPVIYYGDEIGSYGGNDPDNRKMMRFDGLSQQESSIKKSTAELLHFRASSMPLLFGDFRTHLVDKDIYAYSRNYVGSTVIVCLNTSAEKQSFSLDLKEDQSISGKSVNGAPINQEQERTLTLEVEANSYEIVY